MISRVEHEEMSKLADVVLVTARRRLARLLAIGGLRAATGSLRLKSDARKDEDSDGLDGSGSKPRR